MTLVVVERHDAGVGDRVPDAERAGTVVVRGGVVPDRPIQLVAVVVFTFEFGGSLGIGPIEEQLHVVAVGLCKLRCGFE